MICPIMKRKILLIITCITMLTIFNGCSLITLPLKIVDTALDVTKATVTTAANVTSSAAKVAASPLRMGLF